MQKTVLALLVCALLGYVVYQNRVQLKLAAPAASNLSTPSAKTAAVHPSTPPTPTAASAPPPAAAPTASAGPATVRAQVEPLLKPLKVTSILLGDPAVVIINKQDYGVGDALNLPGAKGLKVTAIDEAGVTLVCEHETFHLDAPAAPDLAASRKKF